jgi:hypothetical protein
VTWPDVPGWDEKGGTHLSPDLSPIVREIVDRAGWTPGNALAIVITGTGRRTAVAYNGDPELAPRLHVTYQDCYSLTTAVQPSAAGVVSVQPPANCEGGLYLEGTVLQLQAAPAADHDFSHWSGDVAGSANPATVTMDADMEVVAHFEELASGMLMKVISQSSDDAEEVESSGSVALKSIDLELGEDHGGPQIVGLRFGDLQIPRGAAVSQAYLELTADRIGDDPASLLFWGQATDDASTFVRSDDNISDRNKTTASVSWSSVPPWTTPEQAYKTPDLSSIVQEVVNRQGWSSGNSLVLMVSGSGQRAAISYDGAARQGQPGWAPRLHIQYAGTPACYSLITSASPVDGGAVSASPAPNCDGGKYLEGTEVQLTAEVAPEWGFSHWSGDRDGPANPTTVLMDGPKVVTANFTQECFGLSTGLQPAGSGFVTADPPPGCEGGRYLAGTQVQLAADPAAGWWFAAWSGDLSGGENPITLTMAGPSSVTANFVTQCYTLTLGLVPPAGGAVHPVPPPNCGTKHYVAGTNVELTAEPAEDYQFIAWSGDAAGSEETIEVAIDSSKMVTATFTPDCFRLTTAIDPPGSGSLGIDPPPDCAGDMYSAGTQVRLTADPAGGKIFSNWSGGALGSTNPLTVTLDTDLSITAHFTNWCHLLSVGISPAGAGSVDAFPPPNCEDGLEGPKYTHGTQVQLAANPGPGKRFLYWDGLLSSGENPVVVTLDADKYITATFGTTAYLPVVFRDG